MNWSNATRIVKHDAIRVGPFEIIPLARHSGTTGLSDSGDLGFWTIEPIGIQILTETGTIGLDLDGDRSEELEDL